MSSTLNQTTTVTAQATNPCQNASIRASAGTGKTYLLVSRILRLLLSGAEPSSLLAITFTRKAAAEMHQRLNQRLLTWLQSDDQELARLLIDLGLESSIAHQQQTLHQARHLYEQQLRNDRQIRITTFHAFCQDILRRFPMEADVPPGFELTESTGLLEERAWDGMWFDVTHEPNTVSALAVEALLTSCGSIDSCRRAIFDFLHYRSDWWAFTQQARPGLAVDLASDHLLTQLNIDTDSDPAAGFFSADNLDLIQCYRDLLNLHVNKGNQGLSHIITTVASTVQKNTADYSACLIEMGQVFYTQAGKPRKISASNARAKAMTESGQDRFLELHQQLMNKYDEAIDKQRRHDSWRLSTAWYTAGQQLLNHYQHLKQEQRLLDFTDLEWKTCQLLNDSHHSQWIQYKLDQRISHILVDEFQDTNPTQWRLLLPLLEALAANGRTDEHHWSSTVFLVGDEKQSIYRFRRADPRLFDTATSWLAQQTDATTLPLAVSWRSSAAIIDCVNQIFSQDVFGQRLPGFITHQTHRHDLPGRVELLPLIPQQQADTRNTDIDSDTRTETGNLPFRNPLRQARTVVKNEQHLKEGRLISRHIQQLRIEQPDISYGDIMILVRHRTHLHDYEQALREAGIPFIGNAKKTLLDTLEIQDLVALLYSLTCPGNNLALAQTLRSPIFACSDDDLACIENFRNNNNNNETDRLADWMTALVQLGRQAEQQTDCKPSPLQRAARLLPHWRTLAQTLPVHDLLDRIYAEANIESRFIAAFPPHLQQRVQSNLLRFVEMALEIDSGRYPSLPSFLNQLQQLRQYAPDNIAQTSLPGETDTSNYSSNDTGQAVRILTIHAAKGLEATAVYLIDCGYKRPKARAWQGLIDWPSDSAAPENFTLTSTAQSLDDWSRQRLAIDQQEDLREDANLLYVALTRAQQFLFISGCEHRGEAMGWYQHIAAAFSSDTDTGSDNLVLTISQPSTPTPAPTVEQQYKAITRPDIPVQLELSRPIPAQTVRGQISPSQLKDLQPPSTSSLSHDHEAEIKRGNIVHRLLDLCTGQQPQKFDTAGQQIMGEFNLSLMDSLLDDCISEVRTLLKNSDIHQYLYPQPNQRSLNEVPISYMHEGRMVHGVIDRLIIDDKAITLIDYKTGQLASRAAMSAYQQQMQHYASGIRKVWPQKSIKVMLIFTATATTVELDIE